MTATADPRVGPGTFIGVRVAPTWRDTATGELIRPDDAALRIYSLGLRTGLDAHRIDALKWQAYTARARGEHVIDVQLVTEAGPVDLTWEQWDTWVEHGTLP